MQIPRLGWAAVLFAAVLAAASPSHACTLTMAYLDAPKGILIGPVGDDSGSFRTLYQTAAQRIGCTLAIQRMPKPRVHEKLRAGEIDFYPSADYTADRQDYLLYMPNGFRSQTFGLSRPDLPDIADMAELKGRRLLIDSGNVRKDLDALGIVIVDVGGGKMTIPRALQLLALGRADFYAADGEELEAHFAATHTSRATTPNIRFHDRCCGGEHPQTLIFSRHSPNFAELPNPAFQPGQPLGPANQPIVAAPGSVAARLGDALAAMAREGLSDAIYHPSSSGHSS